MNDHYLTDDELDEQLRRLYQDVYAPVEPAEATWQKLAPQLEAAPPLGSSSLATLEPPARAAIPPRASVHSHRLRQWLGSAVAVLLTGIIILGSIALFHSRITVSQSHPPTVERPKVGCTSAATRATLPPNAYLNAVALTSPTSGWAIGRIGFPPIGAPVKSLILRFQDCHWSPVGPALPNVNLSNISMTSPDDGWITGVDMTLVSSVLLHLVAGRWQAVTIPIPQAAHLWYYQMSMLSGTEGWILGGPYRPTSNKPSFPTLLHLHDGHWSVVTMPFANAAAIIIMSMAPDDAWFATSADVGQTSGLFHYRQGEWVATALPAGTSIYGLHRNAPDDAWAAGAVYHPGDTSKDASPTLLHFNGTMWSPVALKGLRSPVQELQLQMLSADDGWAVGSSIPAKGIPLVTLLQRYVSGTWQTVVLPDVPLFDIPSIACGGLDDCWAVGENQKSVTTPLLHYVSGRWTIYSPVYDLKASGQ